MSPSPEGRSTYAFVTHWTIAAPIEAVWAEIYEPAHWPQWWRGVRSVERLAAGEPTGLGTTYRLVMRSALPYRLRFDVKTTAVNRPTMLEARADGELTGVGRWTLTPTSSGTAVRYDWNVEATRWWMRVLAPIARPIFAWNHDVIMRWGLDGLRRRLSGGV